MNQTEDYMFWRLAHFFISDLEYRIIKLSDNQTELWLEKREDKKAQLIRLLQYDIDWGNWLQQDIEKTCLSGEAIRKQITRGELQVYNLYVSAYPPVDDYEFRLEKPFVHPKSKKTIIHSMIIDRTSYREKIEHLTSKFGNRLDIENVAQEQWLEVDELKREALNTAILREKDERALFEHGKPFFTYIFIGIQVIMFLLLEVFGGSTDTSTLIQFGAKFNPLILEGEWWRFFTPIILHIGFLHLVMNTLALFYLGTAVERIYGRLRFLFIYLVAGFGGSLASFLFSPNLSAGASGAIFGCFGALLYFGMIYPKLFFRTMGLNIFVVLAINLSFGFTVPGIDNAGHIGGLVAGFLATGIVHFPKKKKSALQVVFLIVALLLSSGILRYGYANPSAVLDETSILVMSQEYIEEENYNEAYQLLVDFSTEEELSAQYYFLLSYTEIKLNRLTEAEVSLLKVIELEPNFHEAHYNLAHVYLDKKEYENARKHAEKAVEINPTNEDYQNLLQQF